MVPKICSVEDCERPTRGRGWCAMHYQRWRKTGDPLGIKKAPERFCSIDGCGKKYSARGLCSKHYLRWWHHGDPHFTTSLSLEDRFWSKVDKSADCWEWTASRKPQGYGEFTIGRSPKYAHRLSWEMLRGEIPQGMMIDHMCHNRACVNPDHLRVVTNKQNAENRSGPSSSNTSGVRGVGWRKNISKWAAEVTHYGKSYNAGYFSRKEDAERAVIALRNELFTHNDIDRVA